MNQQRLSNEATQHQNDISCEKHRDKTTTQNDVSFDLS